MPDKSHPVFGDIAAERSMESLFLQWKVGRPTSTLSDFNDWCYAKAGIVLSQVMTEDAFLDLVELAYGGSDLYQEFCAGSLDAGP